MKTIFFLIVTILGPLCNLSFGAVTKEQALSIVKKYLIGKYHYSDFKNETITISFEEEKKARYKGLIGNEHDQWVVKIVPRVGSLSFGGCTVYVDNLTGKIDGDWGLE